MTAREMIRRAAEILAQAGVQDAGTDARELYFHVSGTDRQRYLLHASDPVSAGMEEAYGRLVRQRAARIPLQRLTGEAWFMGRPFRVFPDVLIPRFDTETLAEQALLFLKERRGAGVLDLCTGSGCIIVTLALDGAPGKAVGTDISPAALQAARENARILGADVEIRGGDLFDPAPEIYDLIVSNPPYIAAGQIGELMDEVRLHDPRLALDGGEDGLSFYRRIIGEAPAHLSDGGALMLEIGDDQAEQTVSLMKEAGFEEVRVYRDLAGSDRVTAGYIRCPSQGEDNV